MQEPTIKISDVSKRFLIGKVNSLSLRETVSSIFTKDKSKSEFIALSDINMEIQHGEAIGIIGKNGAGKSTLLKILSKITPPTTGRIEINGRIASLLEVGTGFHPELTGRENIYLNGTILGMSRKEINAQIDNIIEFSGVEKFINTPVKRYSSGMYVRLAFAVAAHLSPEILISDEVLAVGDAEFQKKCLGKMNDVANSGRTVIFVSHNMGAINALCSRCAFLEKGELQFMGDTKTAISKYLHNTANKAYSIENHPSRIGNGQIKIKNISICDDDLKPISVLFSGMSAQFIITYTAQETPRNLIFRLQVVSDEGIILFTCNNFHTGQPFSKMEKEGSVSCFIPKIPMNAGSFTLNIQCLENLEVADELENIFPFQVEKGDFFGTGKTPSVKQGVLIDHSWEHL